MSLLEWFRPKKVAESEKKPSSAEEQAQVMAHLRTVQAGTLRFVAKKLEKRAKTVQNLAMTTILIEEASDFRTIANTLSPESNNVRV